MVEASEETSVESYDKRGKSSKDVSRRAPEILTYLNPYNDIAMLQALERERKLDELNTK
jgi:hypothetical protein